MKRNKRFILISCLIIYPLLVSRIVFEFKLNLFFAILLFYIPPLLYLSFKKRQAIIKASIFSVLSLPFIIIVDYLANLTKAWVVTDSISLFGIIGLIKVETIMWFILMVYFTIIFYEYFSNIEEKKAWKENIKYFVIIILLILLIFFYFFFFHNSLLYIPYFYLVMGLVFVLFPSIIKTIKTPKILKRFIVPALFFFYFNLVFDYTGTKIGFWQFAGEYVGKVSLLGVLIPLEEFVFWLALGTIGTLSYYEFFSGNKTQEPTSSTYSADPSEFCSVRY